MVCTGYWSRPIAPFPDPSALAADWDCVKSEAGVARTAAEAGQQHAVPTSQAMVPTVDAKTCGCSPG